MKKLLLITITIIILSGSTWFIWWKLYRDGIGPTGYWDDEGGLSGNPMIKDLETTWAQSPILLKHFDIREFDSPDLPGSGKGMKVKFLLMLDYTREEAGISFDVTPPGGSGIRTVKHNKDVGGVPDSAHVKGFASDIIARTREAQIKIVRAARKAGFNRFGIYKTFIHLDCDPSKQANIAWNHNLTAVKKGGDFSKFPFDPFTV